MNIYYICVMKKYNQKRKLITLKCEGCNKEYNKVLTYFKRNCEKGVKSFCSRVCSGKYSWDKKDKGYVQKANPFSFYIRNCKRLGNIDLTVKDLEDIWNNQKGICPYSGINLKLSTNSKRIKNPIEKASIDRIDSNKGYIKDNIQFISYTMNLMKNTMTHEETVEICKIITKYWS